ncbi:hypothetical protein ACI2L1_44980, partial [Streptomyces sp. NPDC019531]|uniref:hypothetical protein n=1 Tax=Streptomyces sp. NPDC019531 TaxID=3365062 RepID=UPI00384E08CD
GGRPVLFEVVDASARDVSFLSANPARGGALFAQRADLRVVERSRLQDKAGRAYEHIRLTETAPVPQTMRSAAPFAFPAANQWNSPSAPEAVPGLESQVPSEDRNDDPADGPAALAPRFPEYYGTDEWRRLSEEYEKAVGKVLAADPRVILEARRAVIALNNYLVASNHYPDGVGAAFLRPEKTRDFPSPEAAVQQLVARSNTNVRLDQLMAAFEDAAYLSPSGISLSALWRDRPELNTKNLSSEPPTSETHSASFLQEARERGLRMTQERATAVERLLRVHGMLEIPDGDALRFREALLGWLLPSGRHSLAEVLAAAQEADVRDSVEPDVSRVDGARLHGWVNGVLAPLARLRSDASIRGRLDSDTARRLRPPHHEIYFSSTVVAFRRVTSTFPQVMDLLNLIRGAGPATRPDGLSFEASDEWRHRRRSLAEWLRRHQDIKLLWDNLDPAYAMAVYLVSGVDARLIEELDSTESGEPLSQEARSLLTAAAAAGHSQFPLLFLRNAASSGRDGSHILPIEKWSRVPERRRADSWGQDLRYELGLHSELAAEALEMLPPVDTRVYWTSVVPGPAAGGVVPEVGTEFEWSRFHRATTSAEAALGELRGLAGGEGRPVMWSVERATARDISPLSRTPQLRTVLYPSRTDFRVESAGPFHDVVTGRTFMRVELSELPADQPVELSELPADQPIEPWDQPIVTRDITSGGRWAGVASFDARYWAYEGKGVQRTREIATWTPVKANYEAVRGERPRLLNWDGHWFVAAAHGSPQSVSVVSRYGPRKITGAEWGRHLGALLDRGGLPADTRIFLSSCQAGAEVPGGDSVGQQVADWTGRPTTAPTTEILVTPWRGQPYMGLAVEAGQGMPRLVEFTPRDRTRAATARPGDPGSSEYADSFHAFYDHPSWEPLSREYERRLGEHMAADPAVQRAARHLVAVLGRKYQTDQRVLEVLRRNTAADGTSDHATDHGVWGRLDVVAEAARHYGTPVPTSSSGPGWRWTLRGGHGFPLMNNRTDVAMRLLETYRDLAPARTLPAARAALIAWLLSQGKDSLYEILADSHKAARFPAAERVVLLQDAAHMYAWADTALAGRSGHETPYQTLYTERHRWLIPDLARDMAVRSEALAEWERRHPGARVLDLLTSRGHLIALNLLSGAADRRLLTVAASGGPAERVRNALRDEARAVVREAVENAHADGASGFPRTLLRDDAFRDLADSVQRIPATSPDFHARRAVALNRMLVRMDAGLLDELFAQAPE